MALHVEIYGISDPSARYISFAPSPCRVRQTNAAEGLEVTLRSRPERPGGGQAVFYAAPDARSRVTLKLTLPADSSWVEFWIGGKWESPSIDDRDCLLLSGGASGLRVPLMVRLRKNANGLLPRERNRFLKAWKLLNNAGSGKFKDFRDMHVSSANREEHGGPQFLPWHRSYLLDLERELQAIDPAVSLHYWRFDQPAPNVFRSNFMGATRRVPEGGTPHPVGFDAGHPLSGWVSDGTPGILRSAYFNTQMSAAPGPSGFALLSQIQTLNLGTRYRRFLRMEGTPHGAAHLSFSGYIDDIPTAPKDPLFFMLHSNVDRLWALWQWTGRHTDPDDSVAYQEQSRDGRRLNDSLWPWNDIKTPPRPDFAPRGQSGLAPTPTTAAPGAQPTVRSMIDFQGRTLATARIGYGYDDVPFEFA